MDKFRVRLRQSTIITNSRGEVHTAEVAGRFSGIIKQSSCHLDVVSIVVNALYRMEKVPDTWVQPGDQISLITYSES